VQRLTWLRLDQQAAQQKPDIAEDEICNLAHVSPAADRGRAGRELVEIGGIDEVGCVAGVIGRGCGRRGQVENKGLRVIADAQVVVQGAQVGVVAAGKGAHGQINAVRRRRGGIGDRDRGGVERKGASLS